MARDLRHVVSGLLTFSMIIMLGNMIKRDHFDSAVVLKVPEKASIQQDVFAVLRQSLVLAGEETEPYQWRQNEKPLKPCWKKPSSTEGAREGSKGYITFSLSGDYGSHISQIADAVAVAKNLGATLVLPEITESESNNTRNFGEVYDVEKFVQSMSGVIKVARDKPLELLNKTLVSVKVPYAVSEAYISSYIEPFFRKNGNLKLVSYFSFLNKMFGASNKKMNSYSCLTIYESLHLKPRLQEVAESMIKRLRAMSSKDNGSFVAVDLKIEMSGKVNCQEIGLQGRKKCYNALDIGRFLQKVGFNRETTIYLTQSEWHTDLNALKEMYPNIHTKEDIVQEEEKKNVRSFGNAIDFHICSMSDVYVPAVSGLFYANVVGYRLASGRTQVLVPAQISSASVSDYISPFISKKTHLAYSCFC